MGSGCSKPKGDHDLEDQYAKYAVGQQKMTSDLIKDAAARADAEMSRQKRSSNSGPSPPQQHHMQLPNPATESAGYIYTLDWAALEKDTQNFNYQMMKEDFIKDPNLFLVNQLLMSFQFVRNYEKDREFVADQKKELEGKLNERLTEIKKHGIVTNNLFNTIQDFVGFKSLDEPRVLEPLYPTQYHIAYECVETNRKEDFESLRTGSIQYSQIDEPIYRVCMEPSPKLGYYLLKCVDDVSRRCSASNLLNPKNGEKGFDEGDDTKNGDETLSTAEEDEMEDTIAPLERETCSVHLSMENMQLSPTLERMSLERTSSTERRKVFEPRDARSDPLDPHAPIRRTRSFESNLAAQTVRFQDIEYFSPTPTSSRPSSPRLGSPRPGSPRIVSKSLLATKSSSPPLVEDNYGYAVQKEVKLISQSENAFDFKRLNVCPDTDVKNGLPKQCFVTTVAPMVDNSDSDPYRLDADMEERTYLASKPFMGNFIENFYDTARYIGKKSTGATAIAPRVMCREEKPSNAASESTIEEFVEYIPTVEVSFWPDEAIEWYTVRKRSRMKDKRTNQFYVWPSQPLVMSIIQCGCYLVPLGFISPEKEAGKKGEVNNFSLEWQLQFTKAENILMRSLNHPKIRCYLFALVLHKTFLNQLGSITPDHIRHLLFYMIEKLPADWREEQLGSKLMELIREMTAALKTEKLNHYFASKQNLFASLPKHKLRKAHEKFFRLNENLVPHLIAALQNLQYNKGFYPYPELNKLYTILTTKASIKLATPGLFLDSSPRTDYAMPRKEKQGDVYQQQMHRKRAQLTEPTKPKLDSTTAENLKVNLAEKIETPFDDGKKKLILEFFIEHFVAMARRSNEFRAYGQGLMYIMQAENLLRLYSEIGYQDTGPYNENRMNLVQLREVSRANTRDYWQANWGDDVNSLNNREDSFKTRRTTNGVYSSNDVSRPQHQGPLPGLPKGLKFADENSSGSDTHDGVSPLRPRSRDNSLSDTEEPTRHSITIDVHWNGIIESTDL